MGFFTKLGVAAAVLSDLVDTEDRSLYQWVVKKQRDRDKHITTHRYYYCTKADIAQQCIDLNNRHDGWRYFYEKEEM